MAVQSKLNKSGTGNTVESVANGRVDVRCGRPQIDIKLLHQNTIRVATLNVGTMRGRSSEVVETVTRRGIDICCVQETRWRGASARLIEGKNSRCKFFWVGNDKGTGGVGILVAEKWIDKIFDIKRVNDRIMMIKLTVGRTVVTILSLYAPQIGLDNHCKDSFYDDLRSIIANLGEEEIVIPCGDWNGHIGQVAAGYENTHGGYGYGERNTEGERILEFALAYDMVVANSFFKKRESHLITYQSGKSKTQVDYFLFKRRDLKLVQDIKVIPSEEIAPQHKLLVCDIKVKDNVVKTQSFVPRLKTWKLREEENKVNFERLFTEHVQGNTATTTEELWSCLKDGLLSTSEKICGWTKERKWKKEGWWWNEEVDKAVAEKRKKWKAWKKGGSREEYNLAKRTSRQVLYAAKKASEDAKFSDVNNSKADIFKIAKQAKKENADIVGEQCILNDQGNPCYDETSQKVAWKQHYERLLNEEFSWDRDSLTVHEPVEGPPIYITKKMVIAAINKMRMGKAAGPTGIIAEMLKAAGNAGIDLVTSLVNAIIRDGCIPEDWEKSFVINLYKGKGGAQLRKNYRGLKLLEQVMNVLEMLIRGQVDIDDMQFGFMPGRGTTDAIFIARQLQEKKLSKNQMLYLAFVDLEKAFDRVPRKVLWWSMRKLGVDEWIVKLVQAMYTNAKSRVRVNNSYTDEFEVNVGVHQGSVLSPLLFIIVLEALSREFRTGCPWELLYADDLVIVDETLDGLTSKLRSWKEEMEKKGLRVNVDKTKIMVSGLNLHSLKDSGKFPCAVCRTGTGNNSIYCGSCAHWVHKKCSGIHGKLKSDDTFKCKRCTGDARPIDARPFEHIYIGDEKFEVVDSFCYLGDTLSAGGGCELSSITRIRVAWGKFRELLPILTSRSLSLMKRGEIYNSCVRRTMLHGSECWASTRETNLRIRRNDRAMIRWICNVRIQDRVETQTLLARLKICDIESVLRQGRLRWFGHVHRSDGCIKRCSEMVVSGDVMRGRPKKTWKEVIINDRKLWKMDSVDPSDRISWRRGLKAAIKTSVPT